MKQILVVGSDPKVSQDLDKYLDPKAFKLFVCPQGKSVITSLTNAHPDLVIFDLNSMDNSALEIIKKTKELNSDLPLIVLSESLYNQTKDKIPDDQIYEWLTSPVPMARLASMVKQALSSKPASQEQKILLGTVKFSSHEKSQVEASRAVNKSLENPHSSNQDYHHIFAQALSPIFEQIVRDCRGHIYDCLLSGLEKTILSEVLKHVNHNQVKASQILGISRNTLRERMKRFDIF
jgi:DNA-binding NtrC family response regulator